jgi:ribosomal protein L13
VWNSSNVITRFCGGTKKQRNNKEFTGDRYMVVCADKCNWTNKDMTIKQKNKKYILRKSKCYIIKIKN